MPVPALFSLRGWPAELDADSAELMRALTNRQLAREVGTDSLQLFSIFIPNTYEFYWTVSPEDFVRRMRKEYDRFWTPERDAARRRSGLSRDEVMTLASIVTEETNKADEMPRVAGVYINRLRKGMPLQADPTSQSRAAGFFASPDSAQALENPFAV